MKRKNFQEQMKKEQEELREREKTIAMIKKLYARFGNKILTYMIHYASSENGIVKLFKILNLPMTDLHKDEDQHMAVVEWLNKFGERHFLEMHREYQTNQDMSFSIEPIITKDAIKPLYGPISTLKKADEVKSPIPANPTPQLQKPSPPVSVTYIPPITSNTAPPNIPSQQVQSLPTDGKTLHQVERRSGKERRQKPDRRNDVDLIFKNKRFGGERRSGKDRRKNWKPPN